MKSCKVTFTKEEISVLTQAVGEAVEKFPRMGDKRMLRILQKCDRRLVLANSLLIRQARKARQANNGTE